MGNAGNFRFTYYILYFYLEPKMFNFVYSETHKTVE